MIDACVKWPEGAEYAAQDKSDGNLYFFKMNPIVRPGDNHFCASGGPMGYPYSLPALCLNWHRTIVTREQYAEALAAANTSGKTNQVRESEDVPASQPAAQLYSGVAGVMPPESIESLLAEIKAKREEHDALVAKAEALALEIVGIELQVNDKLKEYGFAMSPLAAPSEPWQPVITDWRDLRVGDVIECVPYGDERDDAGIWPGGWAKSIVNTNHIVGSVDSDSGKITLLDAKDSGYKFRFIRRPQH